MHLTHTKTLLAALTMSATLAGTSSAEVYVYEGFQYSNVGDILMGEPDGAGTPADIDATGLGGTYSEIVWNNATRQQLDIQSGSLSFGDLATNGNHVGSETTSDENVYVRSMTNANIGTAGDLWFSILVTNQEINSASNGGLILSAGSVASKAKIIDQTAANGATFDGIGFGAPSSSSGATYKPYVWDGGVQSTSTGSISRSNGQTLLLVGHLSFNTGTLGADEYTLYSHDLNGGVIDGSALTIIGETLEVDLDETAIDTFNLTRQRRSYYDEFRLASTLEEALAVPEPGSLALLGLGGLLIGTRRRRD